MLAPMFLACALSGSWVGQSTSPASTRAEDQWPWPPNDWFDARNDDVPSIVAEEWLVIPRSSCATAESIFARHLLAPGSAPPRLGEPVARKAQWQRWTGSQLSDFVCAYTRIETERDEVLMLRLRGARFAFVNGEPFLGDSNRWRLRGVPVALHAGANDVFVFDPSGEVGLALWRPGSELVVEGHDVAWSYEAWGSMAYPVFNATTQRLHAFHLHYGHAVSQSRCEPHITDWRCGKWRALAPLSLWIAGNYEGGLNNCDPKADEADVVTPLHVSISGDPDGAAILLHRPFPRETSAQALRGPSNVNGSLFGDLLRSFEQVVFVCGTRGDPQETAAALARARFDQQLLWYDARRSPLILTDQDFLEKLRLNEQALIEEWTAVPLRQPHVILYGNADTNAAWDTLVPEGLPIRVERNRVRLHDAEMCGDDLAGWFLAVRADDASRTRLVVAITATGARGNRLASWLHALTSPFDGAHYKFYDSRSLANGALHVVASGKLR